MTASQIQMKRLTDWPEGNIFLLNLSFIMFKLHALEYNENKPPEKGDTNEKKGFKLKWTNEFLNKDFFLLF